MPNLLITAVMSKLRVGGNQLVIGKAVFMVHDCTNLQAIGLDPQLKYV